MDVVHEQTTYMLTVSFTDQDGAPTTPSAGTYRIDDITGDVITEVVGDTDFVPDGSSHEIEITPAMNSLLDQTRKIEYRLVTVRFIYGDDRRGAGEYRYCIKNMRGVT